MKSSLTLISIIIDQYEMHMDLRSGGVYRRRDQNRTVWICMYHIDSVIKAVSRYIQLRAFCRKIVNICKISNVNNANLYVQNVPVAMNFHLGSSLQPRRGYIADAPVPLNHVRCHIRNGITIARKAYMSAPCISLSIWPAEATALARTISCIQSM